MKTLPLPTPNQAEKAGICQSCVAYRPDQATPSGSHCFSTNKKRIENTGTRDICSKKNAAEKVEEHRQRLLIEGVKELWE